MTRMELKAVQQLLAVLREILSVQQAIRVLLQNQCQMYDAILIELRELRSARSGSYDLQIRPASAADQGGQDA